MIVVGIETSTPQTSVALGTEQEILAKVSVAGKARQESVTPALQQLLAWTGIDLEHVGGVAVGVGPGLFTGLRVGVETAKTLAQVLNVPIVGIPSLDGLGPIGAWGGDTRVRVRGLPVQPPRRGAGGGGRGGAGGRQRCDAVSP